MFGIYEIFVALAELAEPAAYDPRYGKWRREDLPILPESWRFTVGQEKRSQFGVCVCLFGCLTSTLL